MSPNEWTIIGVFVVTQLLGLFAVIGAVKGDSKVLQAQMADVREELKQLTKVMIIQAEHSSVIQNLSDRVTLTGKRLDEQATRLNKFVDAIALSNNLKALFGQSGEG